MTGGIPEDLRHSVERALEEVGAGGRVIGTEPVGGGCIHHGSRVETDLGDVYFLKWNRNAPPAMFDAEVDGLRALRAVGAVTVPAPIAWGDGTPSWLLMEFVEPAPGGSAGAALGEGLARIHGAAGRDGFGWSRDNWIGSLPQENPASDSWGRFWRDARLRPQLERARRAGRLTDERFDRLLDVTPDALQDVDTPELLHGDLWSGNAYASADGAPVLVDPAVYRGDGEVDLAMSELFGGFGRDFYAAYAARRPVSPAYDAFKRDLYQLYYLLVHVNLFGASYEAGARRAADTVLRALGAD